MPSLFTFEVVPVEQWMQQTGCNTRILHRAFEATGKPPLFWNTQLRLHPLNSVWDSLNADEPDNSELEPMEDEDTSNRVWPSMPTITRTPSLIEDSDPSEQEGLSTALLAADAETSAEGSSNNIPSFENSEMNLGGLIAHYLNFEPVADHLYDHLN